MAEIFVKLKEFWSKQEIKLRPGLSPVALAKFESQLKLPLPNDLREYFLFADGFDGGMDNECISFLPMEEAVRESVIWSPPGERTAPFFAFADFLISSHVYMIDLEDVSNGWSSVYVVYDNKPDWIRKVADTFSDFLLGYMANDYSVLFPK